MIPRFVSSSSHLSLVVTSRSPFANQRWPTHKNINNNHNHGIPSLLKICNQSTVLNFTTTIDTIDRNKTVVGEGRLSSNLRTTEYFVGHHLFLNSRLVEIMDHRYHHHYMKIIPIKRLDKKSYLQNQQQLLQQQLLIQMEMRACLMRFPLETDYLDAEKEIKLNQLLGTKSIKGFIDFKGCFAVSGEYPCTLSKEWDKYRKKFPKQAENPRPGKFSTSQLYCCLVFGHAGKDLEASSLNGWQRAASILEQATSAPNRLTPPRIIHNDPKSRVKNVDDDLGELANSMQGISLARKLTSTMKDPLKPGTSGIVQEKPRNCYPKNKTRGTNTALTDHKILSTDPDRDTFGAMVNDYQFECYDLIGGYRGANGGGLGPSSSGMT
ncbi:hypothetical protein PSHT_06232 [Puccinia striiformis]|uniref:Uncharacterized protein n=1 Tax=Puccinia striiformis TaxID=27350 RepID=A0A2S4W7P3_9BASI|nr:hypothetical protein PSHT_06232 [Puccinia striiformis]